MNYLNWNSFEKRREKARLNMAYKIINGHIILEPNLMPKKKQQRPLRQCNKVKVGFENQLEVPQAKLNITRKLSFIPLQFYGITRLALIKPMHLA